MGLFDWVRGIVSPKKAEPSVPKGTVSGYSSGGQSYFVDKSGKTTVMTGKPGFESTPGPAAAQTVTKTTTPTTSRTGSGGGGSSSRNTNLNSNRNTLSQPIASLNPQAASQQAQDQSLSLAKQNNDIARDANQRDVNFSIATKSTRTDMNPKPVPYEEPFSLTPMIYEKQVGTFTSPDTGKQIPSMQLRYYGGTESVPAGGGMITNTLANQEQASYFQEQTNILQGSTKSPGKVSRAFGELTGTFKQDLYQINGGSQFLNNLGATNENIKSFTDFATSTVGVYSPKAQEFISSRWSNLATGFTNKPVTRTAEYAAIAFTGGAFGAAEVGIPKLAIGGARYLGFETTAPIIGKGFSTGIEAVKIVAGFGYATSTGIKILSAPDIGTATDIGLQSGIEFGLFAKGYNTGKAFAISKFGAPSSSGFSITGKAMNVINERYGYPKYEVTFGQKTLNIEQSDFGTIMNTQAGGKIKQINLFSTKEYPVDIFAKTKLNKIQGSDWIESKSIGVGTTNKEQFSFKSRDLMKDTELTFTQGFEGSARTVSTIDPDVKFVNSKEYLGRYAYKEDSISLSNIGDDRKMALTYLHEKFHQFREKSEYGSEIDIPELIDLGVKEKDAIKFFKGTKESFPKSEFKLAWPKDYFKGNGGLDLYREEFLAEYFSAFRKYEFEGIKFPKRGTWRIMADIEKAFGKTEFLKDVDMTKALEVVRNRKDLMSNIDISTTKQGFISGGVSSVRNLKTNAESFNMNAGTGMEFNEDFNFVYGKSYPVKIESGKFVFPKSGRATLTGLSKKGESPINLGFEPNAPQGGKLGKFDYPSTSQTSKSVLGDMLGKHQENMLKGIAVQSLSKPSMPTSKTPFGLIPGSKSSSSLMPSTSIKSVSLYAGTGQYERTDFASFRNMLKGFNQNNNLGSLTQDNMKVNVAGFSSHSLTQTDYGIDRYLPRTLMPSHTRGSSSSYQMPKIDIRLTQNEIQVPIQRNPIKQRSSQLIRQTLIFEAPNVMRTGLGLPRSMDFGMPGFPSFGGFATPSLKGFGRKSGFNIAPSFTAIVQGIKMKNTLNVSKTFGVTPFQTRGLLPKGSKKQYFKMIDF